MPRPSRCRRVCGEPAYDRFAPCGAPGGEQVVHTVDEYEVIRLIDLEKKTHEQCAAQMDISRTTVTETYERARFKLADYLVHGKLLRIEGGHYRLCGGSAGPCCGKVCRKHQTDKKGEVTMRIAVTYENGKVFPHFGHTAQFKVYDVENGAVVKSQVVDTMGSGHGALAGFLRQLKVDTLICGGIGGGAQSALAQAGVRLLGGVSGDADEAVRALLAKNLAYDPHVHCDHHGHEHTCGEHHCGEDKQGCGGHGG